MQNASANDFFPKVNRWLCPSALLPRSLEELARDGKFGNEGTCFWLGQKLDSEAIISHLAILRTEGVEKHPFNVTVSAEAMRQLHDAISARNLILIAQVHSHSSACGVDMSPTDHAYGISVPFFLSVIVPHYAQRESTTIADCGVHVCLPDRGYVKLSRRETKKRIVQTPDKSLETIIIGEVYETQHRR